MKEESVYDILGVDDGDIEALTAYALYERHKRVWTLNSKVEDNSANIEMFAEIAATKDQIERYRKDARDILIAFANKTVEKERPGIEREAIVARIEQAATEVGNKTSVWKQIGFGIIATAINTLFLIIVAIGIQLMGVDILNILSSLSEPAS